MADPERPVPENAPGRFYVDETCIDCDFCREVAPWGFRRDEAKRYSFVARQPDTKDEAQSALEALEGCPVEAIGDREDANASA